MNPYASYYVNQVGSGLPGFQGIRYQRGHGFFGRLFSSVVPFLKQVLPALGKRALPSVAGLAQDIIAGENVKKSALSRLKEAGANVADEGFDILKSKISGSGRGRVSRKRRRAKSKTKPKSKRKGYKKRRRKNKVPEYLK